MVNEDLTICAYYAGHVLGAAMFLIKVGNESVLYTGLFLPVYNLIGCFFAFFFSFTSLPACYFVFIVILIISCCFFAFFFSFT